jgi:hypothetical protein
LNEFTDSISQIAAKIGFLHGDLFFTAVEGSWL